MAVLDLGLKRLRDQVDALAPNRSKASDGWIGDAAHQAEVSDHNPEDTAAADAPGNPDDQVDALDLTHDPAHGADMGEITEAIRRSHDRRVSYVIFNTRIFSGPGGPLPFVWRHYDGTSDPHTGHAHVSVNDVHHDETQNWVITMPATAEDAKTIATTDGVVLNAKRDAAYATDKTLSLSGVLHKIHEASLDAAQRSQALLDLALKAAPAPAPTTVTLTEADQDAIVGKLLAAIADHLK